MEAKLHSQKPSLQKIFITPQDHKRDIDIQNWPKERLSNGIETLLDEIAVIVDETGRSEKKNVIDVQKILKK